MVNIFLRIIVDIIASVGSTAFVITLLNYMDFDFKLISGVMWLIVGIQLMILSGFLKKLFGIQEE